MSSIGTPPRELRVLHVHKFRRITGGVETHVHALMDAQARAGMAVDLFTSEDVDAAGFDPCPGSIREAVRGASTLLWSRNAARAFERRLRGFRPTVVHFHSVYHQLSPSVVAAAAASGTCTVMTLHDYKLVAPCYVLQREGHECRECVGLTFPTPAVRHACVKNSRAASMTCAIEQLAHRRVYQRIDQFLVPSAFMRNVFASASAIPAAKISVAPLGVVLPDQPADPGTSTTVLFFGRVAEEKGITELLRAWERAALPKPWQLRVVGDGPLQARLKSAASSGVAFVGHREGDELARELGAAAIVVVPSLSPETFGLSAAEAMAAGVPVLVSDAGNLPALVGEPRQVLPRGVAGPWAEALRLLADDSDLRIVLGRRGRERIAAHFSECAALDHVIRAYSVGTAAREPAVDPSYAVA